MFIGLNHFKKTSFGQRQIIKLSSCVEKDIKSSVSVVKGSSILVLL